jgi:hypothetical protein
MVTESDILWSSYSSYEGPYFPGKIRYSIPENPSFRDKLIRVVTATEGGTYDAINMYDTCILTVGVVQLCEKLGLVSSMLGECSRTDFQLVQGGLGKLPIPLELKQSGQTWRMFVKGKEVISSPDAMKRVFFNGSTGKKGEWKPEDKQFAKRVACVFANLWESESLKIGQNRYIKNRIMSFVVDRSKKLLFTSLVEDGYEGATKALFISYSLNNPSLADSGLFAATQDPAWTTADWKTRFNVAAKHIIYDSKIAIWPGRYPKVHDAIEKLFNVQLPTLQEIAGDVHSHDISPENLGTVKDVQGALLKLGYDLGPKRDDGVLGDKTKGAIVAFQCKNGIKPNGVVDSQTKAALLNAVKSL